MNRLSFLGLAFVAATSFADDGILGTKGDTTSAFQPAQSGGGNWIQMILALVIVLGAMKFVLPKLMSPKLLAKLGGKFSTGLNSEIKIEESASFPGGNLHLVTIRGRSLLLGTTASSITTLADLGMKPENNPGDAFMDILDRAVVNDTYIPEPTPTNLTMLDDSGDVERGSEDSAFESDLVENTEATMALRRLSRLMK
jgi:flagellar biogenesis protein FliO